MAAPIQGMVKRFPVMVVLAALIAAASGVLFFFWALRSCPLVLDEGTLLTYRLRTELRRDPDRPEVVTVDEQTVDLYCLNQNNDVALLARGEDGERISLLRLGRDGSAAPYNGELLKADLGHAIGFFDFNLLPLPLDSHQSWEVTLHYGYLPVGRQEVTGQVSRVRNGPNPEFELRLDTVEWVEREPYEHWRSLSNLVVRYRYDASRRIVDRAHLTCRFGLEGRTTARFASVDVHLELERWNRSDQPVAMRDLALATAELQAGRYSRHEEQAVLLHLLDRVDDHPRLQALARRLMEGGGVPPRQPAPPTRSWQVQVASVEAARRPQAEAVVAELRRQGWPGGLIEREGRLLILVGPFREQDAATLATLRALCGDEAFWVQTRP
jgi:hypothetical protein